MKPRLTRRQLAAIAVLLLTFALAKGGLIWWYLSRPAPATAPSSSQLLHCHTPQAGCPLPDGSVLRFASAPRSSQPFMLTLDKGATAPPLLEFSMRDMDMGFNRYRLQDGGARWQAKVTLPVCVSGSGQWLLSLRYADGRHYQLPFDAQP